MDFEVYKNGDFKTSVKIGEIRAGKIIQLANNFDKFKEVLSSFISYEGISIKSANKLAKMMAGKARLLNEVLEKALSNSDETDADANDTLRKQLIAFQNNLMADMTPGNFADMYAQTITYGMFAARLNDKSLENFTRREAAECIPESNPFLRGMFDDIAGTKINKHIKWIVDDLAKMFSYVDVKEILKGFDASQDPIIHFYETFLSEYDKSSRKNRGVWYTPKPVVSFIVKSVDQILKTEFGITDGISDSSKIPFTPPLSPNISSPKEVHKVQILDPATGTGTFLAEIITQIYETKKAENKLGTWDSYVKDNLLPRLHGFEILMAPYAMAHLKLDLILKETGYTSKGERLKIFLTNSLEEAHEDTGNLFSTWLADEAIAADYVKKYNPIMVVLGNPPYSGKSSNNGNWIKDELKVYKQEPTGGKLNEKNPKWINDDYVKFIRYAELFVEKNSEGVVGYINNHCFLDNPTFRGMRWNLLNVFDKIYIINLHGSSKTGEVCPDGSKDENVFGIQQGVSINIFIKKDNKSSNKLAEVYYHDVYGLRDDKLNFLDNNSINTLEYEKLDYRASEYFFTPKDFSNKEEYDKGFSVDKLLKIYSAGIITANDKSLISCTPCYENDKLIDYRIFDKRYIDYNTDKIERPRYNVMRHMFQENMGLVINRQVKAFKNYQHVFITKNIIESAFISNKTSETCYLCPLYLYTDGNNGGLLNENNTIEHNRKPNLDMGIVNIMESGLKLKFVPEKSEESDTFAPIDILDYIYAILHSSKYREKYNEFLKIDFPKIPYPINVNTFWDLVKLGGELREIHLLESDKLGKIKIGYPIIGDNTVENVKYKDNKVYINETQYFDLENVPDPEIIWSSFIGGYQPAQKLLKDRKGRKLDNDDFNHYEKIINALCLTKDIMAEIEKIDI